MELNIIKIIKIIWYYKMLKMFSYLDENIKSDNNTDLITYYKGMYHNKIYFYFSKLSEKNFSSCSKYKK
jgi:hypothetical protein